MQDARREWERARRIVESYVPFDERETVERAAMLDAIDRTPDILFRTSALMHLTASGWIVNPARDKALMVYHNIYRSWSWSGGHADGEGDLLAVSLREALEETGVSARPVRTVPISLDILPVQAHVRRGQYVPPHLHFSLCYLFEADESAPLRVKPDENSGVSWIPFSRMKEAVAEAHMLPLYEKLMRRAKELR